MSKDNLGDRMKRYESVYQTRLIPRSYTIIRIDGKSFHTYTKNLKKPFDKGLVDDMIKTTKYLCENIQGCKLGYVQSDEISLLLTDFDTHETQAWFGNETQKMLSISASMTTAKFNHLRIERFINSSKFFERPEIDVIKLANFDSRVFQVPNLSEVYNYFLWRQKDAIRNSISASAQSLYSHKELHQKTQSDMQELIFQKGKEFRKTITLCGYPECHVIKFHELENNNYTPLKDIKINWNDLPNHLKRGMSLIKGIEGWETAPVEFNYDFFELNIPNNI